MPGRHPGGPRRQARGGRQAEYGPTGENPARDDDLDGKMGAAAACGSHDANSFVIIDFVVFEKMLIVICRLSSKLLTEKIQRI